MNKQELIKKYEQLYKDHSPFNESVCYASMIDSFLKELKQLDEPQKVKVSQGIVNYIEYTKINEWDLLEAMDNVAYEDDKDLRKWFNNNSENFALAWIFGYDVEKEKRYFVKMKGVVCPYLNHDTINELWFYNQKIEGTYTKTQHTRKELEEAGFEEVFNSPLFEVEEVAE